MAESSDPRHSQKVAVLPRLFQSREFAVLMSKDEAVGEMERAEGDRRGRWKSLKRAGTSMKKYLRKKIGGSDSGKKDDVVTVNIQPDDDSDHSRHLSKRFRTAQTFDSEGQLCSSGSSSAKSRDSAKSSASMTSTEKQENEDILVVHDADDDLDLYDYPLNTL